MTFGASGGDKESEEEKPKLNEENIEFLGRRSETDTARYGALLQRNLDLQHKRQRAAKARHHFHMRAHGRTKSSSRKKTDGELKDTAPENTEHPGKEDDRMSRRNGAADQKCIPHPRSRSRTHSNAPSDRCGRCKRRRRSRPRRRRSCRRRRRRRRRSRRRRRRSCRRRRRRRRRRRC